MHRIKRYHNFLNEGNTPPVVYYDMNMEPVKIGDLVELQVTKGRYGQTTKYQGRITNFGEKTGWGQIEIDGEKWFEPFEYDHKEKKYIGRGENYDYEHGHTRYCKKITEDQLDPKLSIPKDRSEATVRLVDYTNGKNKEKSYYYDFPVLVKMPSSELDSWMKQNYPNAKSFKMGEPRPKYNKVPYLSVHISTPHSSGHLKTYYLL